jgi:hypothetical protein
MSGMSISGGISTAAAALLDSLSEAPLALDLLLRVRVVRSRDISVFSLGRDALGRALYESVSRRVLARLHGAESRPSFVELWLKLLPIMCRG